MKAVSCVTGQPRYAVVHRRLRRTRFGECRLDGRARLWADDAVCVIKAKRCVLEGLNSPLNMLIEHVTNEFAIGWLAQVFKLDEGALEPVDVLPPGEV